MNKALFQALLAHPKTNAMQEFVYEKVIANDKQIRLQASRSVDGGMRYRLLYQDGSEDGEVVTSQEIANGFAAGKPWVAAILSARGAPSNVSESPDDVGDRIFLDSVSLGAVTVSVLHETQPEPGTPPGFRLRVKQQKMRPNIQHFPLGIPAVTQAISALEGVLLGALSLYPDVACALFKEDPALFAEYEKAMLSSTLGINTPAPSKTTKGGPL
ncbi:hypothetical protein [Pseudoduganella aquatica]|uniref:Uncharacterized protein n=1 Tax=Pseudoduganella aquatica TaxID=2660641 RepID=A0A7X4HG79_9BURK|nr:hypothetical protein [Pseudoduganella aquatica]MYN10193.1 hypothetical protein [Pseudoduganella aquatica]